MPTQDTQADEEAQLDYGHDVEDDWLEETEEPPRRPRRKLLSPVPAILLVILLVAMAFFAGVKVEKGQSSSSTSSGFPAGLAALRGASSGSSSSSRTTTGTTTGGGGGFPSGGGFPGAGGLSGGLTTGEVSYVSGSTLYVNSGENTVKVSAPTGTKVSKTVSTSVHSIHPGDTVIVRGSQGSQRQRHSQLDQHQLDRFRDRHQQLERIERRRRSSAALRIWLGPTNTLPQRQGTRSMPTDTPDQQRPSRRHRLHRLTRDGRDRVGGRRRARSVRELRQIQLELCDQQRKHNPKQHVALQPIRLAAGMPAERRHQPGVRFLGRAARQRRPPRRRRRLQTA